MAKAKDTYASEGKRYNRRVWTRECSSLVQLLGRPLDAIWLSGNQFVELTPMQDLFRQVWVPELEDQDFYAKRKYLAKHPELQRFISLPNKAQDVLQLLWHFSAIGTQFDVINLDYCIHFCPNVERAIGTILRGDLLRPNGRLFLTVSQITKANKRDDANLKVLARKVERIVEQVDAEFRLAGREAAVVAGFPYEYPGQDKETCRMFSFGWQINPVTQENVMNSNLSAREKQLIVNLRKSGVASNIIANAFGVKTGTVAALVAHSNRATQYASY